MKTQHSSYRAVAISSVALVLACALHAQTGTPKPDEVVQLEAFQVTTTLGKYAEVNSSAGSKTPMDLKDLPSTVQVLNASFINDLKAQTLEDLYPYVIGMTREATQANGFTLRGFSSSNPDVSLQNMQVDGLPGLASRFGSPNTANVERVEVLKGPSSVLYGLMNPGGLINVVTKSPQQKRSGSFFTSAASYSGDTSSFGDDESFTARIDTTGPIDSSKHWLYRFIASVEDLRSFRHNGYFRNHYFFPSLTYRWDENTDLTLKIDITRQRRFADNGLVAPFNTVSLIARHDTTYGEKNDYEYDNGETYGANFRHRFGNQWVLRVAMRNVQHHDGRYGLESRGVTSAAVIANSLVLRRLRDQVNARQYSFVDANVYGEAGPEAFKHTLLLGLNGGYEQTDFFRASFGPNVASVNLYAPALGTAYPADLTTGQTDPVTRYYNYGSYVSDQIKIGRRWRASLGARYDRQDQDLRDSYGVAIRRSQSVHAALPSAGLMFQPRENVSLYVSYSTSFRPIPVSAVDASGKPGFAPEKASQIEAGVKTDFLDHKLTAILALYDITKKNVVETVGGAFLPDGTQISALVGEQESTGTELQLTYLPVPHWQLQAGYAYDDARTTKSLSAIQVNARLWNAPRQQANLWTRYNVPDGALKGFGSGLGVIYVGNRLGAITNNPALKLEMAAYTRVDAAFYYQWKRYSFALNVANALDRSYVSSARTNFNVFPGEPRKLTLSLNVPF